jgi:hypothetical protein
MSWILYTIYDTIHRPPHQCVCIALREWTLKKFAFFQTEYMNSKVYPIFPRYTILKDMIKDIMHNPDYMEVCHEVDV